VKKRLRYLSGSKVNIEIAIKSIIRQLNAIKVDERKRYEFICNFCKKPGYVKFN
jgi:hypothetical protein